MSRLDIRGTTIWLVVGLASAVAIAACGSAAWLPTTSPRPASRPSPTRCGAEVRHLGVGVGVAHPSWIQTDMVAAAEEHPVFGPARRRMPAAASRAYPVFVAVDRLEAGIARRARTIHIPRSMLAVKLARAFLPPLVERAAGRFVPEADQAALEDVRRRGRAASEPVGPGGAAAFRR